MTILKTLTPFSFMCGRTDRCDDGNVGSRGTCPRVDKPAAGGELWAPGTSRVCLSTSIEVTPRCVGFPLSPSIVGRLADAVCGVMGSGFSRANYSPQDRTYGSMERIRTNWPRQCTVCAWRLSQMRLLLRRRKRPRPRRRCRAILHRSA